MSFKDIPARKVLLFLVICILSRIYDSDVNIIWFVFLWNLKDVYTGPGNAAAVGILKNLLSLG